MLSSNNKKKNKDKNGNNTDDNNEENKKDDKNQVDEFGNKIDKNAKALINRFKVQLFKFSLLGIDVKGFQEFWCNYGPKGSKKDLCFLRPALYLGKFSLSIKEFKVKLYIILKIIYFIFIIVQSSPLQNSKEIQLLQSQNPRPYNRSNRHHR